MGNLVHIHVPPSTSRFAEVIDCPSCKLAHKQSTRSLHLVFSFEWYGPSRTCLRCGRRWEDGEWMPLGFWPGSRQENIKAAIKRWRSMNTEQMI